MPSWALIVSGYRLGGRSFGQGWRDRRIVSSSVGPVVRMANGDRVRILVGGVVGMLVGRVVRALVGDFIDIDTGVWVCPPGP